ncbi:MAG: SAM-dependent methyltransferase [Leptolyngbyaceae cyanobacterium bins.59]|nr:SAM-dependent methyltransferase [Leptolyngbyaceae cyanobacterium bins.59]
MAMRLEKIVPFGRSWNEYCQMFNLTETDLAGKIIGVGDGPASFNAEMNQRNHCVISIDPIYQFTAQEIHKRFYEVVDSVIEQVRKTPEDWVWSYHKSADDLKQNRIQTLEKFLQDYDAGKQEGRYLEGELPQLGFDDRTFDLALCSHLLFLYSEQLNYEFHLQSILEMLRIAREVRIFPLVTLMLDRSPHLDPITAALTHQGYEAVIHPVSYEFQKGGNQMLVVRRSA